jgi:hypothetical protein
MNPDKNTNTKNHHHQRLHPPWLQVFDIFLIRLQKMEVGDFTSRGAATDDAHWNQA